MKISGKILRSENTERKIMSILDVSNFVFKIILFYYLIYFWFPQIIPEDRRCQMTRINLDVTIINLIFLSRQEMDEQNFVEID